jgi:hypothetical protein
MSQDKPNDFWDWIMNSHTRSRRVAPGVTETQTIKVEEGEVIVNTTLEYEDPISFFRFRVAADTEEKEP